jgi:hypothetical protein
MDFDLATILSRRAKLEPNAQREAEVRRWIKPDRVIQAEVIDLPINGTAAFQLGAQSAYNLVACAIVDTDRSVVAE